MYLARYDEIVGSKRSVDIVINCAGILSDSQIEKEIDINFVRFQLLLFSIYIPLIIKLCKFSYNIPVHVKEILYA